MRENHIAIIVLLAFLAYCTLPQMSSLSAVDIESSEVSVAGDVIYYVAIEGDDSWSGRLPRANAGRTDGPFATFEAACKAARKHGTTYKKKIIIQPGRYFLEEPLVFTDKDSNLTIESAPGAKVCIYGGRKVTGWKKDGEKFYSADLSGVKEGSWDFRALVVNGRFCPRARLPEKGYFEHLSKFNVPWMSTTGCGWKRKPRKEELTTL
jgi:hypothetical protein